MPRPKGYKRPPFSEEWKRKLSLAHLGRSRGPHSAATKRKMSLAQKARIPRCGWKHTEETKRKIAAAHLGVPSNFTPWNKGKTGCYSKVVRQRMSESAKGKQLSEATRKKISAGLRGEKSYRWQGGITELNHKIRTSLEYRLWREAVFKRDGYKCVVGGKAHGSRLEADHIKPFCRFPELRLVVSNGRTLCKDCHRKTPTWGARAVA